MSGDGNSGSDLSLQLANLLKNGLNTQPSNPKLSDNLQINLKLNPKTNGWEKEKGKASVTGGNGDGNNGGRSSTGFGGVVAAADLEVDKEGTFSMSTGYQDGSDNWAWH